MRTCQTLHLQKNIYLSACLRCVKSDQSPTSLVLKVWIPVMDMMPVSEQFKYHHHHQHLCLCLCVGSEHPLKPSYCVVECQVVWFPFVLWGLCQTTRPTDERVSLVVNQVKESRCSIWLLRHRCIAKIIRTSILSSVGALLFSLVTFSLNSLSKDHVELSLFTY